MPSKERRERAKKVRESAKKRAFLGAYAICLSIPEASKAAGVKPTAHKGWIRYDEVYRKAFEAQSEEIAQALEVEAIRRAYEGVRRQLYYKGRPMRTGRGRSSRLAFETEYSDALLIALLKRFRPALYRERTTTEVTGSIDLVERLNAGRARVLKMQENVEPDRSAG